MYAAREARVAPGGVAGARRLGAPGGPYDACQFSCEKSWDRVIVVLAGVLLVLCMSMSMCLACAVLYHRIIFAPSATRWYAWRGHPSHVKRTEATQRRAEKRKAITVVYRRATLTLR